MLPLPPVIGWTLLAVGVTALSKVLVKEWRRVNAELDAHDQAIEPAREQLQTLRRDPRTGVYRPQ
jgi:hypothetical protein